MELLRLPAPIRQAFLVLSLLAAGGIVTLTAVSTFVRREFPIRLPFLPDFGVH